MNEEIKKKEMDVIKSGKGEWCNKMGNKFFIFFLDFLVIMRNMCFSSVIIDLAKFKSGINSWWGKKANQNWQNFCTFQILVHQTKMLWSKFHGLSYTSITNLSTFLLIFCVLADTCAVCAGLNTCYGRGISRWTGPRVRATDSWIKTTFKLVSIERRRRARRTRKILPFLAKLN